MIQVLNFFQQTGNQTIIKQILTNYTDANIYRKWRTFHTILNTFKIINIKIKTIFIYDLIPECPAYLKDKKCTLKYNIDSNNVVLFWEYDMQFEQHLAILNKKLGTNYINLYFFLQLSDEFNHSNDELILEYDKKLQNNVQQLPDKFKLWSQELGREVKSVDSSGNSTYTKTPTIMAHSGNTKSILKEQRHYEKLVQNARPNHATKHKQILQQYQNARAYASIHIDAAAATFAEELFKLEILYRKNIPFENIQEAIITGGITNSSFDLSYFFNIGDVTMSNYIEMNQVSTSCNILKPKIITLNSIEIKPKSTLTYTLTQNININSTNYKLVAFGIYIKGGLQDFDDMRGIPANQIRVKPADIYVCAYINETESSNEYFLAGEYKNESKHSKNTDWTTLTTLKQQLTSHFDYHEKYDTLIIGPFIYERHDKVI